MKNTILINLLKPALLTITLFFAFSSSAIAQDSAPTPPAANNAEGGQTGEATAPQSPATGNTLLDEAEDYDSSGEPFGRGCPYGDNELELVS